MPLRPRRGYAAAFPRSLPGSSCPPPREFPATTHDRCAPHPAQIHQVRAGAASRGCHTPVPHVLLSVTLAGPRPSGSTGPSRLCQGCSHPPRHHSGRAALSFTALLRQDQRRRSLTSSRTTAPHGAPTTCGTPLLRSCWPGREPPCRDGDSWAFTNQRDDEHLQPCHAGLVSGSGSAGGRLAVRGSF